MKELEFSLEMAKEGEASVIIPKGRPVINVGTVPPSEMGLVDVEGLINVDKIPDNLKNKIEYPKKGPAPVNKAEGGVITLADVARNMNRGPRGVAALAPIARNMNRPMVS
jgi:hypothetical protein